MPLRCALRKAEVLGEGRGRADAPRMPSVSLCVAAAPARRPALPPMACRHRIETKKGVVGRRVHSVRNASAIS